MRQIPMVFLSFLIVFATIGIIPLSVYADGLVTLTGFGKLDKDVNLSETEALTGSGSGSINAVVPNPSPTTGNQGGPPPVTTPAPTTAPTTQPTPQKAPQPETQNPSHQEIPIMKMMKESGDEVKDTATESKELVSNLPSNIQAPDFSAILHSVPKEFYAKQGLKPIFSMAITTLSAIFIGTGISFLNLRLPEPVVNITKRKETKIEDEPEFVQILPLSRFQAG